MGDKVRVKILNTNHNKISLSMKAVEESAQDGEEEKVSAAQYSSREEVTTSLGDLLKNLKLWILRPGGNQAAHSRCRKQDEKDITIWKKRNWKKRRLTT